jgi:prepilin-type N-terminal cleavage/methylation domain-containing protein
VSAASRDSRGFTLLEAIVVMAVLALAAALAVPVLTRTSRTASRNTAAAAVRERMKALATEAAAKSRDVTFACSSVERAATVAINPPDVSPPDGTVLARYVTFQAGTGYPVVDGARASAAVVVAEGSATAEAVAVVAGRTGSFVTYRRTEKGWEETQ